jgi:hypothetical protein
MDYIAYLYKDRKSDFGVWAKLLAQDIDHFQELRNLIIAVHQGFAGWVAALAGLRSQSCAGGHQAARPDHGH